MTPASFPSFPENGERVLPLRLGDLRHHLARRRALRERRVRPIAHDHVADAHPLEHVEDEVLAVRGRLAARRDLRVVERPVAEHHERDPLGEHQRYEEVVAPGELARHDERRERHVREAPVEDPHPDEREGPRIEPRIVEQQLRRPPERAAEEPPHDERRPEVPRAAARSDGERRRDDLHDAEHEEKLHAAPPAGEPLRSGDRDLRRAVPAAEDPEPLPRLPHVRADEHHDRRREEPEREPPDARLDPVGELRALGEALRRAERAEKAARDDREEDGEERVERQVRGDERVALGVIEEGRLAEERDEDGVRDDAREDGRNQRIRLEVVAMEHLDGEERGAERRAEHGGHTGGRARDEEDAPLAIGDVEVAPDERADRPADLHRRPFAPAAPARPEAEDRREDLHPRHAPPDDPLLVVERVDDRVCAAAARLGGEPRDGAADERAERGDEPQEPRTPGRGLRIEDELPGGLERQVPREPLEEHPLHDLEPRHEERPDEPRRRPDERRVQEHSPEDLEPERRRDRRGPLSEKLRHPPYRARGDAPRDARRHGRRARDAGGAW